MSCQLLTRCLVLQWNLLGKCFYYCSTTMGLNNIQLLDNIHDAAVAPDSPYWYKYTVIYSISYIWWLLHTFIFIDLLYPLILCQYCVTCRHCSIAEIVLLKALNATWSFLFVPGTSVLPVLLQRVCPLSSPPSCGSDSTSTVSDKLSVLCVWMCVIFNTLLHEAGCLKAFHSAVMCLSP